MGTSSKPTLRLVSQTVTRFNIWDNFDRHVNELRSIGAADADIERLRQAAAAVDVLEKQSDMDAGRNPALNGTDLGALTQPRTCANGWVIAPPSSMARRWAMASTLKITGGATPDDGLASVAVALVALWVLMMWGDGKKDLVMRSVMAEGRLAELIPQLIDDHFQADQLDALIDDYLTLMGFLAQKKTAEAANRYQETYLEIRTRLSA